MDDAQRAVVAVRAPDIALDVGERSWDSCADAQRRLGFVRP